MIVFCEDFQKPGHASFETKTQTPLRAAAFGLVRCADGLHGVVVIGKSGVGGNLPYLGAEQKLFASLQFGVVEVAAPGVFALSGGQFGGGEPAALGVPVMLP